MNVAERTWRHVFKLDPDKPISDESLERVCLSGTDGLIVGGSSGVTYDNTAALLSRIRKYATPCVLEISDASAIVPGYDGYLVPIVLNTPNAEWITGRHQRALAQYGGAHLPWRDIAAEGYMIMNPDCTAAALTSADATIGKREAIACALLADKLLRLPIVYMEYSGMFGDMELVSSVRQSLSGARLVYGGGIRSRSQAEQALRAADTIVVGNIIYDNIELALETVSAIAAPASEQTYGER